MRVGWWSEPPEGDFAYQTFFQSAGYARFLAGDHRRPRWLVAGDEAGRARGRWLVFEQAANYLSPPRTSLGRRIDVHLVANHAPALAHDCGDDEKAGIWSALLAFVARHCRRARPVSITLRLDPVMAPAELETWRGLAAEHGFASSPAWSYVSDLPADSATMFQRIKSDRRTKVRKGESDGVTFEVGRDIDAMREYYAVRTENARRNEVGDVPWSHFQAACDVLGLDGANRVFLARKDGRLAAAQLALIDRGFVTLNGVSVAGWSIEEKVPANDVLQWKVIEWSIANGMKRIDYVGANPGTDDPKLKAIDHFKSRWGTELRESLVLRGPGSELRRIASRALARAGL
jgi:hypothetical protein